MQFGRGYRAGYDVREQRRKNDFYENLIQKRAEKTGEEVSSFLQARADFNAKQDAKDKDEDVKHWSEKTLEEMTVR